MTTVKNSSAHPVVCYWVEFATPTVAPRLLSMNWSQGQVPETVDVWIGGRWQSWSSASPWTIAPGTDKFGIALPPELMNTPNPPVPHWTASHDGLANDSLVRLAPTFIKTGLADAGDANHPSSLVPRLDLQADPAPSKDGLLNATAVLSSPASSVLPGQVRFSVSATDTTTLSALDKANSVNAMNGDSAHIEVHLGRGWEPIAAQSVVAIPAGVTSFPVRVSAPAEAPTSELALSVAPVSGLVGGEPTVVTPGWIAAPAGEIALSLIDGQTRSEGDAFHATVKLSAPLSTDQHASFAIDWTALSANASDLDSVWIDLGHGWEKIQLGREIVIPSGISAMPLLIKTADDSWIEGDETFQLSLRPLQGLTPTPASATLTIVDHEPPVLPQHDVVPLILPQALDSETAPTVVISPEPPTPSPTLPGLTVTSCGCTPRLNLPGSDAVEEGGTLQYNLSLSKAVSHPCTFRLDLDFLSASANDLQLIRYKSGSSWQIVHSGDVLEIPAGVTSVTLEVLTRNDQIVEDSEQIRMNFTPVNGLVGGGSVLGTIIDNDIGGMITARIQGASTIAEGSFGKYRVVTDQALTEDTWMTVKIDDGLAHRVDQRLSNQLIGNPGETASGYRAFTSADQDFTVSKSGTVNLGNEIKVLIRAGQTTSEEFRVDAWSETSSKALADTGWKEGDEFFKLTLLAGPEHIKSGHCPLTVTIADMDKRKSPIIIDLNGDGVHTIGIEAGVQFDMDRDGRRDHTGWVDRHDGLLAVDADHDGKIDDQSELFGGGVGEGFAKLKSFDSNHDGFVDQADERFQELKVWQDANSNGETDAGELIPLSLSGVNRLAVEYETDGIIENGNLLLEKSLAYFTDGRTADMVDAYFMQGDPVPPVGAITPAAPSVPVDAASEALDSYGPLAELDLHKLLAPNP